MKGLILDYTSSEAFILLNDDSIITIPKDSLNEIAPIGSNISLCNLYNRYNNYNYKSSSSLGKTIDFF